MITLRLITMKYRVELYEMNLLSEKDRYDSDEFYVLIGLDYSGQYFNFYKTQSRFTEPYPRTRRIAQICFGDTNICPENPFDPLDKMVDSYVQRYNGSIQSQQGTTKTAKMWAEILINGCREFAIASIFNEFGMIR